MPLWQPNAFLEESVGLPAPASGEYIIPWSGGQAGTSATLGNSSPRVAPWLVAYPIGLARVGMEFTVAGEANSVFRMGIWLGDAPSGRPLTLVQDFGSISTGTGNAGDVATGGTPGVYERTLGATLTLAPGLYWIGGAVQGAPTTQPTIRVGSTTKTAPLFVFGTSIPSAGAATGGYISTNQAGAFTNFSSNGNAGSIPRLLFKVA